LSRDIVCMQKINLTNSVYFATTYSYNNVNCQEMQTRNTSLILHCHFMHMFKHKTSILKHSLIRLCYFLQPSNKLELPTVHMMEW